VAESQTEHANRLTLAVVSDGPPEDLRAGADELGLERALVDEEGKLYRAFKANATPSAVPIAADGTIAGYVESGRDAIEAMIACALEGPLPVGSQVPALELASLDGEPVKLTDLAGRDTLLLLWNPDCGYCRAMHEDVLAWETAMNGHTHPRDRLVGGRDENALGRLPLNRAPRLAVHGRPRVRRHRNADGTPTRSGRPHSVRCRRRWRRGTRAGRRPQRARPTIGAILPRPLARQTRSVQGNLRGRTGHWPRTGPASAAAARAAAEVLRRRSWRVPLAASCDSAATTQR